MTVLLLRCLTLLSLAASIGASEEPRHGHGHGPTISQHLLRARGYPPHPESGIASEDDRQRLFYEAEKGKPEQVFQLAPPVLGPHGLVTMQTPRWAPRVEGSETSAPHEEVHLFTHSFRSSEPFETEYKPPKSRFFNRALLNITVAASGFQTDRLAILYLGDVEIWRMSTPVSKPEPGISWSFAKDVTAYLSRWKKPQRLVLDLRNPVDDVYPAALNVTMAATFFRHSRKLPTGPPADEIVSLGTDKADGRVGGAWKYPKERLSKRVLLPRNIRRARLTIAATAQEEEEFWWSNAPESNYRMFENTTGVVPSGSAFRELRLTIDGHIAGIAWPFPAIFPGGIGVPMHRPAVPLQAFDLRESEIDVTPWLPYLCDGRPHNFTLDLYQFDDTGKDKKIRSVKVKADHWLVNAKMFLWLDDDDDSVTTGTFPRITHHSIRWNRTEPVTSTDGGGAANGTNYEIHLNRMLRIETRQVKSQHRDSQAGWAQELRGDSKGYFILYGLKRGVVATYKGRSQSTTELVPSYHASFEYPISAALDYRFAEMAEGKLGGLAPFTVHAKLAQSVTSTVVGASAFPSGVEPWLDVFLATQHEVPGGSSTHASRHGLAVYYQTQNCTRILGTSTSLASVRFGMAPQSIDALPQGFVSKPLLYRRDLMFNGTRGVQDEEWTFRFHKPYKYQAWVPPPTDVDDEQRGYEAQQQPDSFAPVKQQDGWRLFMGHLLPMMHSSAEEEQQQPAVGEGEEPVAEAHTESATETPTAPFIAPVTTQHWGWKMDGVPEHPSLRFLLSENGTKHIDYEP